MENEDRAISFLGTFVSIFRYNAFAVQHLLAVFSIHSDILGKEEDVPPPLTRH